MLPRILCRSFDRFSLFFILLSALLTPVSNLALSFFSLISSALPFLFLRSFPFIPSHSLFPRAATCSCIWQHQRVWGFSAYANTSANSWEKSGATINPGVSLRLDDLLHACPTFDFSSFPLRGLSFSRLGIISIPTCKLKKHLPRRAVIKLIQSQFYLERPKELKIWFKFLARAINIKVSTHPPRHMSALNVNDVLISS